MGRDELKKTVTTMAAEGPLTNATVRTRLGIDRGEALRLLSELVAEGRLVRYGERKGTRYELSSGMLKL